MSNIRETGNFDNQSGSLVLETMILDIHKSIAYLLSDENRAYLHNWHLPEFAAFIALFALLAEKSKSGPGIKDITVQKWRTIYFAMYDERYDYQVDEPDLWRTNILEAFERLETIARLRPPYSLSDD